MKITYNNTTIDFFNFKFSKKLLVSLSGGCDSSAALYLVCKYFPGTEIIPFVARDENAPKDADAAELIVSWFKKTFPNIYIHNLSVYNFNDRTEDYVSFKTVKKAIKTNSSFSKLNRTQVSKILQIDNIAYELSKKYPNTVRLDGMTKNPPDEIMHSLNFYSKAERRRDQGKENYQLSINPKGLIYQPFINVDKKFVADIYKKHNLINSLLPLTRSCVGTAKQTDNFTRECHNCFWCYERAWAFDLDWLKENERKH